MWAPVPRTRNSTRQWSRIHTNLTRTTVDPHMCANRVLGPSSASTPTDLPRLFPPGSVVPGAWRVGSVAGARVAQFVNNERSFVFQVDSEEGGHYLLQAAGQLDMKRWVETIERVSKMTSQRRLTYLGGNVKPQMSDDMLAKPAVATRDPVAGAFLSLTCYAGATQLTSGYAISLWCRT